MESCGPVVEAGSSAQVERKARLANITIQTDIFFKRINSGFDSKRKETSHEI